MRDPKRIKRILHKLEEVWNLCGSDLRLMQLLSNLDIFERAQHTTIQDPYYVEDEQIELVLDDFLESRRKK